MVQLKGEKLIRPPKDFPVDFEDMELIKLKSFTVSHHVQNDILRSDDFESLVLNTFKEMLPLNKFLNQAVSH